MGFVLQEAPDEEPVSLAEAKAQCRVDGDDENALIEALIVAARQMIERETNRSLVTQTWRLDLDRFCERGVASVIRLAHGPVQEVVHLRYFDELNVQQELDADAFIEDLSGDVAKLAPAFGTYWPCTARRMAAVSIEFITGYGDEAEDVPQLLRQAILFTIAHWFDNRTPVVIGQTVFSLPMSAQAIIDTYRIPALA